MSYSDQQVPASDAQEYTLVQMFAGMCIGGGAIAVAAAFIVLGGGFSGTAIPMLGELPVGQQLGIVGGATAGFGLVMWLSFRRDAPWR